ncbi:Hypothetical protein SMAX5B_003752 [Scophthalmus maximus]|uniref:B box-type domain-containing protein n=1 Tax=Scophthalmus maximus TaxID=52904 RepID=A0A2U9B0T7_SCOMX|nr:Hypothetical protein SMAX5B_003752 [Scophthalmus maximus]
MSDNLQNDTQQVILCDMCTKEDRKPAKKTCMKCEISMCVQHLQAHLTTPVLLQTHPLTEPMGLCGTTKCPQHGKLLEYYCLDDMTCVCVSCAIEDQHRLHNMKTFSTAHKELMEKLRAEQKALLGKTDGENGSLEKWKKGESEKLRRSSVRLIEAVTVLRDMSLSRVQSSVSARMVSIKTSRQSMQAAQSEKDDFRFLQMYSEVHQHLEKAKGVDLAKGLEPGSDRDKLVKEIKQNGEKMMQQAGHFVASLFTLVDPDLEPFSTGADLSFETQISADGVSLSKDNRKVFYSSWMGQCAATLLIRSPGSAPNVHRWMVCLSKGYDWTIGLCDKQSAKNLQDGPVYGLCCKDNQLSSLTAEGNDCFDAPASSNASVLQKSKLAQKVIRHRVPSALVTRGYEAATVTRHRVPSPLVTRGYEAATVTRHRVPSALVTKGDEAAPRPETVEVFWNFAASSLSFFGRTGQHQREEILTIEMSLNNWDLVPFVRLGTENVQNYSSGYDWPHNQWKCPCGMFHNRGGYMYGQQTNCSCGEIIGGRRITEVVCELL